MGFYVDANVYANFDNLTKAYNYVLNNKEEFEKHISDYAIKLSGSILKISGYSIKSFSGFLQNATKAFDGYIASVYEDNISPGDRYTHIYTKGQLVADYEIDLDDDKVNEFRKVLDPEFARKQQELFDRLEKNRANREPVELDPDFDFDVPL